MPMSTAVDRSKRPFIIASIMLATFMVAIEATIVATAMPRIVGELGGFTYYSWVFSAFLLAQSTTTVIYGMLELAGVHDVLTKSIGSTNPHNVVKAVLIGLQSQRGKKEFAALRQVAPKAPAPAAAAKA
jgi:hypothetical protein